ncbi:hypothetical protein BG74_00590 [Sodalis-like endosymbiont of Proechinophthirus fluctus]|nr:hypothetical protein BG74_00590 [Sodalis-like endosymbiont of Proechinophthirus fluctus]
MINKCASAKGQPSDFSKETASMEAQVLKKPALLLILNGKSAGNKKLCQNVKFYRKANRYSFASCGNRAMRNAM